jgi:hypothetical protein
MEGLACVLCLPLQRAEAGEDVSAAEYSFDEPEPIQARGANEVVVPASLDSIVSPQASSIPPRVMYWQWSSVRVAGACLLKHSLYEQLHTW